MFKSGKYFDSLHVSVQGDRVSLITQALLLRGDVCAGMAIIRSDVHIDLSLVWSINRSFY